MEKTYRSHSVVNEGDFHFAVAQNAQFLRFLKQASFALVKRCVGALHIINRLNRYGAPSHAVVVPFSRAVVPSFFDWRQAEKNAQTSPKNNLFIQKCY